MRETVQETVNGQYLAYVRSCGEFPPHGLWTEEIHRRCFCMRRFLESYINVVYGETVDLRGSYKDMTVDCRKTHGEDWLGYCASLLDRGNYPEPFDRFPLALEAGIRYIVSGDYETKFLSPETIKWSYTKITEVLKEWITHSL